LIIGNEILSGRTVDANLPYLAKALGAVGIRLAEARVVPDDEAEIVAALNACRAKYRYVFTTGGIGPTHDDITAAAVARAFGRPLIRHPEAERRLLAHFPPEKVIPARMSMADTPEGAELIDNPVSVAPGFRVENVFVMAGVPSIMQAMLDGVIPSLEGGATMQSRSITLFGPEGLVAEGLGALQTAHPEVEIGSYPFFRPDGPGTVIVVRGTDPAEVDQAAAGVVALAERLEIGSEETASGK
jgi:molybdenum cofactor synthesis domain-containing protein